MYIYTYSLSPKAYSMNDENAKDRQIDQNIKFRSLFTGKNNDK